MFTHFTWLKFALWNVLQDTGRPLCLHNHYQHSGLSGEKKRGAKSHILKNGRLSFPFLHSTCFFPFLSTEFQIHIQKCVLWDIHVMFLNGIAKTNKQTKSHSQGSVFPSQLILQDQGSVVCQQISIPTCGLSWCHMTFPVFPTCKLHRTLGVEQSAAMERRRKKLLLLLITS